ncbi:MAG: hypothetical protein C0167_04230 [Nitrososphaera sp.]|nr:MAG: hypothetical protein C0167_04230 [Nitrososphaera sp.]
MNVIIMAGGRGSRLVYVEKPLVEVCGRPMVDGVISAATAMGKLTLCTSRFTPNVEKSYCGSLRCVRGSGDYVSDLETALEAVGTPALVLPADMPFIDRGIQELRGFVDLALVSHAPVITLNVCRSGAATSRGSRYSGCQAGSGRISTYCGVPHSWTSTTQGIWRRREDTAVSWRKGNREDRLQCER